MVRRLRPLLVMAIGALAFQSCTCHQEQSESEPVISKRSGFNAALPTRRREARHDSKALSMVRVTPVAPTLPAAVETPTAGVVELPEDFPSDVPVFEKAEAFAVQPTASNGRTVLFHVDAEPKEIFSFYKDNMQTQGWNMSQDYQTKDQSFLSFKKGKTITNVTIAKDPRSGRQIIALMYYQEQDLSFPEF